MGFFDSLSDLFEAATPWSTVEAEAVQRGGSGSEKTPADKDEGGEGEAEVRYRYSLFECFWVTLG
jgi:ubiquinol-cytochrome c reductase subunit 6